jgi:ferredoxin
MSHSLRVNPIACDAHGMCAELLPERIELDDWGYPIVDSAPLEPALVETARRAAQACPTLALLMEFDRDSPRAHRARAGTSEAQSQLQIQRRGR